MGKKLYKAKNKTIMGVCGGLSNYYKFDKATIQILFVILAVVTGGTFAIVYLILGLVLEEEPKIEDEKDKIYDI